MQFGLLLSIPSIPVLQYPLEIPSAAAVTPRPKKEEIYRRNIVVSRPHHSEEMHCLPMSSMEHRNISL